MNFDRIIDLMENGNWTTAAEEMTEGAKGKPYVMAARGIRLCGILEERFGEHGLNQAAVMIKALENAECKRYRRTR